MKPNEIVQPTPLACRQMYRTFMPWHRGVALSYPDQYNCVWVKWTHKKSKYRMAGKFIEGIKLDERAD